MELLFAPAAAKALSPSLTQHAASLLDGLLRAHLAAASAVTAAMSEVPMLWLPLIVCLGLGLAGSAYRIASAAVRFPGLGSLVGRLWLARRVLCILRSLVRKLFPRRAFVQAAPRRTSSSPRVDYGAVAALPTAFASGCVCATPWRHRFADTPIAFARQRRARRRLRAQLRSLQGPRQQSARATSECVSLSALLTLTPRSHNPLQATSGSRCSRTRPA